MCNAGVGIGIVPIAGEMLQHTGHPLPGHGLHHFAGICCRLLRPLAQGARIDKIAFLRAYIAHGRKVHIDAKAAQKSAFFQGVPPHGRQPVRLIQLLGRRKRRGAECGKAADAVDGAALFIYADKQRHCGRRLIAGNFGGRCLRRSALKIF